MAKDQDPGYWATAGHPEVTKSAVTAYRTRYQFLHYFYTGLFRSHTTGETFARPVFHEFPREVAARKVDTQYMLGSAIMITPFLFEVRGRE